MGEEHISSGLQAIPVSHTDAWARVRQARENTVREEDAGGLKLPDIQREQARKKGKTVHIKIPVVERQGVPALVLVFGIVMGMLAGYLVFEFTEPENSQYIQASEITGYTAEDDTLTLERADGYEYKIRIEEDGVD